MFNKQLTIEKLMTDKNKTLLKEAIIQAEQNTSGEIRVHLENYLPKNSTTFERAVEIFNQLEITKTGDRNGMLIYVAYLDRQFAILGDTGINEKVGQNFWDSEKQELQTYFKEDRLVDGLIHFIKQAGEKLKDHFPYQKNDVNELPNDISIKNN